MRALILFIILGCSLPLRATTIEIALFNYQEGKFSEAYKAFQELAAIGNTKAQFNIGVMYARGEHVETDFAESWAWFKLTEMNQGDDVQKIINLLESKMTDQNKTKAIQRFEQLRESHSNEAIAQRYLPQNEATESSSFKTARKILSVQARYPSRMLNRGFSGAVDVEFMIDKDGTVRYPSVLASTNAAFSDASITAILKNRYEPAMLDGKPVHEYGRRMRFVFNMEGAEINYKKVEKIFNPLKEKAETGGGSDKYQYAYTVSMVLTMGNYMDEENSLQLDNPNSWFSKAAQDGFSPAKYELGKRLAYGKYCAVDTNKAFFWLEQAAEQGLAEAQLMLGLEYLSGVRTTKDPVKGLDLIKKAADKGYDHASLRFGLIVSTKTELNPKELSLAKSFFEKVNEKDYPDSLSYYETAATLYYAVGEKKKAQKMCKKGLKAANERELEAVRITKIITAIESDQRYIEAI